MELLINHPKYHGVRGRFIIKTHVYLCLDATSSHSFHCYFQYRSLSLDSLIIWLATSEHNLKSKEVSKITRPQLLLKGPLKILMIFSLSNSVASKCIFSRIWTNLQQPGIRNQNYLTSEIVERVNTFPVLRVGKLIIT